MKDRSPDYLIINAMNNNKNNMGPSMASFLITGELHRKLADGDSETRKVLRINEPQNPFQILFHKFVS